MTHQQRNVRRNFLALGCDYTMFFIGFVFWDPTVVVPAFVKELTGSDFMVGILSAVRILMITLPALWAASMLVSQPRKKPLIVWASLGGRLPVLLLAFVTLLWAGRSPGVIVGALTIAVALFFTSEGMNYVSWPTLIGKVLPARIRGRFLGTAQLLASFAGLGSGALVRLILGRTDLLPSARWAMIFACAFLGFALSWLGLLSIREEPDVEKPVPMDMGRVLRTMWDRLRADRRLQRVVAVQLLLGTAGAVYPFFVVRARDLVPGGDEVLGLFLIAQNLGGMSSALLCGYLIDHVGSWSAIRLQAVVQGIALLAVTLAKGTGIAQPLYLLAFFSLGFSMNSWWAFTTYLLDLAAPSEQPTYLAASGILSSPTVVASILVGGLFSTLGPEALFAVALALSVTGALLGWGLARVRSTGQPEQAAG